MCREEKTEDQSTWFGVVSDIPGGCKRFTVLQGDPTAVGVLSVVGGIEEGTVRRGRLQPQRLFAVTHYRSIIHRACL